MPWHCFIASEAGSVIQVEGVEVAEADVAEVEVVEVVEARTGTTVTLERIVLVPV